MRIYKIVHAMGKTYPGGDKGGFTKFAYPFALPTKKPLKDPIAKGMATAARKQKNLPFFKIIIPFYYIIYKKHIMIY